MEKIQGAEAEIIIEENEVLKKRLRKKYRHPELDNRIIQERTKTESDLIERAHKYNINVPKILEKEQKTIKMEKIEGNRLKSVIRANKMMTELGRQIARMHNENIIHGDLTTNNIIINEESQKPFIIDFGLAEYSDRVEDKAVDLHVFKQVLSTSHPQEFEEAWEEFAKSYRKVSNSPKKIFDRLKDVEKRGRYK